MKASELVRALQAGMEKHGDRRVSVRITHEDGQTANSTSVREVWHFVASGRYDDLVIECDGLLWSRGQDGT